MINPLSMPTVLECPRCNSKLRQSVGPWGAPQIYYCPKCGYKGPIALQPIEKEKVKKKNNLSNRTI